MLKDITLGQYFPGSTVVHRLDPRAKILLMIAYIVVLFMTRGVVPYILATGFVAMLIGLSKIQPKLVFRGLKPLVILLVFTSILNLFNTPGRIALEFWIFKITYEGIENTIYMIARIVLLITSTSMLTYTTSPIALTDAIERLLSPLKKLKVPVHEFAMMMTIALRFIPTLIEETDKIMSAQKARGADFESGNILARAKALVPILVPLFISAFRRAEELAVAMECRLYHGGEGRTRLHTLKMVKGDYLSSLFCVLFFALIVVTNIVL